MASHWCDRLIGSGPPLVADNKVFWWSFSGPLSAANDKLFYWFTSGPPSVADKVDWWSTSSPPSVTDNVDWWSTSGPRCVPTTFYGGSLVALPADRQWSTVSSQQYWQSISGPLLAVNDKLFYWSTSGSPSSANNPDSMQMLAQRWHIRRSDVGSHCWPNGFLAGGCFVGLTLASHW